MDWKKKLLPWSLILLLSLAACNLPGAAPLTGVTADPAADQLTAVARAVEQTRTAAGVLPLLPSETPSITLSSTPDVPRVTVSVETNCRSGPGTAYEVLGVLPVGVPAEVVGRNASSDTWIIKLPSNPSITCWLWGYYGTVTGSTAGLTVYTPPPTPTPSGSFTFVYDFWGVGPGYQCPWFEVTNTGGVTWESFSLTWENQTDGGSWTSTSDSFTGYDNWCFSTGSQLDLEAGEIGIASVTTMMMSPSGDHIKATLTLCSGNGLSGYCTTKILTFNF